jgi:hypothetical protein
MLAITLHQPWAWTIAQAGQDVENRSWKPSGGGFELGARVAIHAGRAYTADAPELAKRFRVKLPASVDHGVITCTVVIAGWVHESGDHSDTLTPAQARATAKSRWFMGPYGWVLRDVQPPPPAIADQLYSGRQGFWLLR